KETSSSSTSSKSTTQINSYRQRRLILADSSESSFNSYELRELLNKEFKNQLKVQNAVIAMITKSQRNQNVVLTTTEHFSADFLQKNQSIWQKHFKFSSTYEDKMWHKVIVHGVPTDIFNFDEGLKLFEDELKTFNSISSSSILSINWLSTEANRNAKMHASVVISLNDQQTASKL